MGSESDRRVRMIVRDLCERVKVNWGSKSEDEGGREIEEISERKWKAVKRGSCKSPRVLLMK